jgi:hypothetical protein
MPTSTVLEKVIIYNNLGQKVMENVALDFSVTTLSTGIHFLDLHTSDGIFHKKFIKK